METITVLLNWGGSRVLNKRSLSLEICFELEATMPQLLTSIEQCHFSKWSGTVQLIDRRIRNKNM